MRGGYTHNELLIAPIEAMLRPRATFMQREYRVQLRHDRGAIDLFARFWPFRLAVEAELSADRVDRDLAKANAVDATHLWIITPNGAVRRTVRRRVGHLCSNNRSSLLVHVLTPPQAPQALESCFPLFFDLIPPGNQLPHRHAKNTIHSASSALTLSNPNPVVPEVPGGCP